MKAFTKYIILLVYIVVLIVVGVLIGFFGSYVCVTKSCNEKANFILTSMDNEVDPCDDFYQFTCGNYDKLVKYRKNGVASVLDHISYDVDDILNDLLRTKRKPTDDRILKIVKKIYQPCMDVNLVSKQGVKPLWDAIWIIGGFPVVQGDDWDEKAFSIGGEAYKSRKVGFVGQRIFKSYVAKDVDKPGKYVAYIEPPNYGSLPGHELITERRNDKEITTETLREHYLSYIVRLTFHLLNKEDYEKSHNDEIRNRFKDELNKTLNFKIGLGKQLKSYWELQDPTDLNTRMKLKTLQDEIPYIDWKDYFEQMLPPSEKLPQEVIVRGKSFFKGIKELIKSTRKRTIANFLMMESVMEGSLFLPNVFFSIYNKFRANIKLSRSTRDQFCQGIVKNTMRGALSSLFLDNYNLTVGSQKTVTDIAEKIHNQVMQSVQNVKWMDKGSKKHALLKLKKVKYTLSLSDEEINELINKEGRANFYEELCLGARASHVLPSYFCINKFHSQRNWELLSRKPTVFDKYIDVFTPKIVYNQVQNEILVPYSVLKYPAFNVEWPNYLNYGGIGSVLGAVFIDGYDLSGSEYNELGFHKNWWSNKTKRLYDIQSECFRDGYISYMTPIEYVSPDSQCVNLTRKSISKMPEYITVLDGVHLAHKAYLDFSSRRYMKEQRLLGLEKYTAEQLFFIGFSSIYCSYYKPKKLCFILEQDKGIPYSYRVNGSLQYSEAFSEAFGCKLGNPMFSRNKCTIL